MASLGKSTFERGTLARFFEELRSVGMEGRYLIPKYENQRQYVICGVFSRDELVCSDKHNSQIEKFTQHLRLIDQNKDWKLGSKFIFKERIAILLNMFGRHGEARLFDPNGILLYHLGITAKTEKSNVIERHRYLDIMKQRFIDEFGTDVEPYIVLLSHLIPCTEEGHECARLIREYVEQTMDKVIVSYDSGWQGTDKEQSLMQLTHENIYIVDRSDRRAIVNREIRSLRARIGDSKSLLQRANNSQDEQTDDLDCLEVASRKKKSKEKWATLVKQQIRIDLKKKRRTYSRDNLKTEWFQSWNEQS